VQGAFANAAAEVELNFSVFWKSGIDEIGLEFLSFDATEFTVPMRSADGPTTFDF
jgi:hypothetical protein